MITYIIKKKVVCVLILLSILALSGCFPDSDDNKESSVILDIPPSSTLTISPLPFKTLIKTETPSPAWMVTPTPSPSYTHSLTPFPHGHILYDDDFETGREGLNFEEDRSKWQTREDENGNHFLCNADQSKPTLHIGIGDERWRNYQLEFEIKDTEFTNIKSEIFALLIREHENSHYTFLVTFVGYKNDTEWFSPEVSNVSLGKSLVPRVLIPLISESLEEPFENRWYRVKIKVDEGDISIYWNDELVLNYHDEEYLPKGSISFYANYGICLDNIRVTSISDSD
jgi:hypothetical protein